MNEREVIAHLRRLFPRAGDDAAIVDDRVITNDMLVEDVDFTRAIPLEFIARKSLAVNLSDLAAMGAKPEWAVVALGIPKWVDAREFIDHIAKAASAHHVEIIGGDLSAAEKFVVSITAAGRTARPLLRSGARRGERLYVSRPLGASAVGLQLLQNGWSIDADGEVAAPAEVAYTQREFAAAAIRRHVDPEPEVALGMALSAIAEVTSCIDISDGLSTDLDHLCEASQCGALVERERIPLFPDLLNNATPLGIDVSRAVLHGGEEFALLFTSSLRESDLSSRLGRPVYAIGRMTEKDVLLDGKPLEPQGWDHFM
ncbi:MAG: thiamine-phosphate kinase [Thermoanaerobaculia bacterium]